MADKIHMIEKGGTRCVVHSHAWDGCRYVGVGAHVYVCTYCVYMYACVHMYISICMHACMHVCRYVCISCYVYVSFVCYKMLARGGRPAHAAVGNPYWSAHDLRSSGLLACVFASALVAHLVGPHFGVLPHPPSLTQGCVLLSTPGVTPPSLVDAGMCTPEYPGGYFPLPR